MLLPNFSVYKMVQLNRKQNVQLTSQASNCKYFSVLWDIVKKNTGWKWQKVLTDTKVFWGVKLCS